jgi:hypothetical protein
MSRLYAEHDVLVKLARFEGFGLPPLEAFHVGIPCVLTPFTAHEEYARHGENALVVGFDDAAATGAALDLLARDRSFLRRLSRGALETAARWPAVDESTAAFADAAETLIEQEPPAPAATPVARQREVALNHLADTQETYVAHLREVQTALDEVNELYAGANRQLAEVRASRAYRAVVALRRVARGGGDP